MKKFWLKVLYIIIGIIVIVCGYCMIKGHIIQDEAYSYLENRGYTRDDIIQVDLKHSFLNKLLGYDEWRILVEFKEEPNVYYRLVYRNHEIINLGISPNPTLDKQEILEYDEMFKNGELKK